MHEVRGADAPISGAERMLSLTDIYASIRCGRRIVFISIAVFGVFAVLYSVFSLPLYTATVVVQPADQSDGGSLSALASRFGAAASLAGINIGGGGSGKESYLATLRSRELAIGFIKKSDLLPYLFPVRWDETTHKWKEPGNGLIARCARLVSDTLAALSGDNAHRDRSAIPTDWEAYKEFTDVTDVRENDTTGMVSVSFEFRDPVLASKWANAFVAFANDEIRAGAVEDASRAYAFLGKKAEETTLSGLKDSIFRLMESQLETITLANARQEYAFKVIDPATLPEERSHPKRALIVILSLFAGLFVGGFIALAKDLLKSEAATGVEG